MSRHAGAPLQAYARGSTSGVVSMACRCMVSMLADLPHWLHGHAARARRTRTGTFTRMRRSGGQCTKVTFSTTSVTALRWTCRGCAQSSDSLSR